MLDFTNCNIDKVAVHQIGNKTEGGELKTSNSLLDIGDDKVRETLFRFFLRPFLNPDFYSFTFTTGDFNLNPLFNLTSQIFDSHKAFHLNSINIAKHLYEISMHPRIKPGDLFVAYLSGINMDDKLVDAIGIFKSENKQAFLKLNKVNEEFSIQSTDGINIEKLDKGCLIFNVEKESGYKVCIVDTLNKSVEAQYWKDDFLALKPYGDSYNYTKETISVVKTFITKQLVEELDLDKSEQIFLLNNSLEYFKANNDFDKNDFEDKVFQHPEIIKSFRAFDEFHKEKSEIMLKDNFEISSHAVKRQAKILKSVLKLDENFHIYIHGNRELIERGVDENGRKFYKIYFENEK